jgi:ABC-2 type transport system permease protein
MESAIFSHAIKEFLRVRRLLPWILFSIFCGVLANYWPRFQPDISHDGQYVNVVAIFIFRLVALSAAIVTTAIVSQEVEQKTIVYLLTRPVKRKSIILFRYLASLITLVLIGVFGLVCTSLGAHLGFSNPFLGRDVLAVVLGSAAYSALDVGVSPLRFCVGVCGA